MFAKFPGYCQVCKGKIQVGDSISPCRDPFNGRRSRGWKHDACAGGAKDEEYLTRIREKAEYARREQELDQKAFEAKMEAERITLSAAEKVATLKRVDPLFCKFWLDHEGFDGEYEIGLAQWATYQAHLVRRLPKMAYRGSRRRM